MDRRAQHCASHFLSHIQDRVSVFRELEKPHPSIKLLYTTPEQLQSSEGLLNTLQGLYKRYSPILQMPTSLVV